MTLPSVRRGALALTLAALIAGGLTATPAAAAPQPTPPVAAASQLTPPAVAVPQAAGQLATAAPVIKTQPTAKKVNAGSRASFSVKASGQNLKYQWQQKPAKQGWASIRGATRSAISLTATPGKNGAQYRVLVSNAGGRVYSRVVTLTVVLVKPKITTQPKSQRTRSGRVATFTVAAAGYGVSYRWQKKVGSSWKTVVGAKSRTVKVTAAVAKNGLTIRAIVANKAGSVASRPVSLSVVSARHDPYPLGHATTLTDWRVVVNGSNTNAWSKIKYTSLYAKPPRHGYRYVTARTTVQLTGAAKAEPWLDLDVKFVGGNGHTYTETYNVIREDGLFDINTMYRGAKATFVTVVEVPNNAVAGGRWRVADDSDWMIERVAWYRIS